MWIPVWVKAAAGPLELGHQSSSKQLNPSLAPWEEVHRLQRAFSPHEERRRALSTQPVTQPLP